MKYKNNCIFASSFPPKDDETIKKCLSSWKKHADDIILIQSDLEIEYVKSYYNDVSIIKNSILPQSFEWSKPYCPNIMEFIKLTEHSDVVIINSDIYLDYSCEEWNSEWKLENDKSFICGVRTHYNDNSAFMFEPYGIDIFKLPKGIFKYFKDIHTKYLIGMPGWDFWLLCKLIELGFEYKCKNFDTRILHKFHTQNWNKKDLDYAMFLFDTTLYEINRNSSLSERAEEWGKFIQAKTDRTGWSSMNQLEKTLEFINCTNITSFDKSKLDIYFKIYTCFEPYSNFVINNMLEIAKYFNLFYFDAKKCKQINKKDIQDILFLYDSPLSLGKNSEPFVNKRPRLPQKIFVIRNPLDILVAIYLNLNNNFEKLYTYINFEFKNLIVSDIEKYKNMSIDEFVIQTAPHLNKSLIKTLDVLGGSNVHHQIIYYEKIINNKHEFFQIISKILTEMNIENIEASSEEVLSLIKLPVEMFENKSLQPEYYKEVLQKNTIDELNIVFQEFINNFYNLEENVA